MFKGNDVSSRYASRPTCTNLAAMFRQLRCHVSRDEATEAVQRYCRSLRINSKETEALARWCKWDEQQLTLASEIIKKYECFETKDSSVTITKKANTLKKGGKFSMTQDMFFKFTKIHKSVMLEKSEDIFKGNLVTLPIANLFL